MATLSPRTIVAARYKILSFVGQGGMGKVYRAEHLGLKKVVALKVVGAEIMGDLEARFEREARATARLDHPGCARILDYGRTDDRGQYIAMELVDGPTLTDVLARERQFSVARAVRVASRATSSPRSHTRTSRACSIVTSSPTTSCSRSVPFRAPS